MTPHISANKEDIANLVIMPGDPLRAKFIAETYLTDYKLVNDVRGMLAYTGFYNNKRVTVMGHGMGIPSIGIYAYELYHFYDVEKIIRIGTSGTRNPNIKLYDLILATKSYSVSDFAKLFSGDESKIMDASLEINEIIKNNAHTKNIDYKEGMIVTSDVFDHYVDQESFMKFLPDEEYLAVEMESFALFYLAKHENKKAACLLTVVDSIFDDRIVTPEERESSLTTMIELALDSI